MNRTAGTAASSRVGFHDGELAVQQRAGVLGGARRLVGMLDTADLRGGVARFLADRTFAALAAQDADGRLWVTSLTGAPGFLEVTGPTTLYVHAAPRAGDPLHDAPAGQPVGMIVLDLARRRRIRVNGILTGSAEHGLVVEAEQAYGNCPQYIQQRVLEPTTTTAPASGTAVRRADSLGPAEVDLVRRADTFVLGTTHPDRGSDASHRGGSPGFVRVDDDGTLWWPDYQGNNMFNSLGNIAVDPRAALLFVDFATGETLHLSGSAVVEWVGAAATGDDGHTGRRVRVGIESVVTGPDLPLHADGVVASPYNPPLTGL